MRAISRGRRVRAFLRRIRRTSVVVRSGRLVKAGALPPLRTVNAVIRGVASLTHRLQLVVEWGLPPTPSRADHYVDVYWQWRRTGSPAFLERGVLNSLGIDTGSRVLDLCSGDGFFARHFYAARAGTVVAVDVDEDALRFARRYNAAPNIDYVLGNVLDGLPPGPFDNVIWDATIQYFEREEARVLCRWIRDVLTPNGLLSGSTLVETGSTLFAHHRMRFANGEELAALLRLEFPAVRFLETHYEERQNLYFFAGQAESNLPDLRAAA